MSFPTFTKTSQFESAHVQLEGTWRRHVRFQGLSRLGKTNSILRNSIIYEIYRRLSLFYVSDIGKVKNCLFDDFEMIGEIRARSNHLLKSSLHRGNKQLKKINKF